MYMQKPLPIYYYIHMGNKTGNYRKISPINIGNHQKIHGVKMSSLVIAMNNNMLEADTKLPVSNLNPCTPVSHLWIV